MKRYSIVFLVLLMCSSVGTAWALFESKKELVNTSRITLAEAIDAALKAIPGKAVEAYIEKEDGRAVFEVEIIDTVGKTQEVYIDAQTGDPRKIENE